MYTCKFVAILNKYGVPQQIFVIVPKNKFYKNSSSGNCTGAFRQTDIKDLIGTFSLFMRMRPEMFGKVIVSTNVDKIICSKNCQSFFKRNGIISVFNQLDAQNLFHNKLYFMPLHVSSSCAHHQEVKIALHSLWYRHTYRCDDIRGNFDLLMMSTCARIM